MNKLTKKILCLVMVLMVAVAFTACGKKKSEKTTDVAAETEVTNVNSPEDTIDNFFNALFDFEFEKAAEYTTGDAEDIGGDLGLGSLSDLMDIISESENMEGVPEEYRDDLLDAVEKIMKVALNKCEYEIIDSKESDGKYIYTVKMISPDFEALDTDAIMSDISEEEVMQIISDSGIDISSVESEEELMGAIMGPLMDYFVEKMDEVIENADTIETTGELTLVEVDGQWLIEV